MDGSTGGQPNQSAQPQNTIRPDQVHRLPHLDQQRKIQYSERVKQLWDRLGQLKGQENTEPYKTAYSQLQQISSSLVKGAREFQARKQQLAQQAQAQQQQAVTNQGMQQGQQPQGMLMPQEQQQQQQQQQQQFGQPQPQAQAQPQPQPGQSNILPQVQQKVTQMRLTLPPNIQSEQDKEKWLSEAKGRVAAEMNKIELSKMQLQRMNQQFSTRQQQGHQFSQEELDGYTTKKGEYEKVMKISNDFLAKFKQQQEGFRQQIATHHAVANNAQPNGQAPMDQSPVTRAPNQQIAATQAPAPHTISSAVNAARQASSGQIQTMGSPRIKQEPGVPQPATSTAPTGLPMSQQNQDEMARARAQSLSQAQVKDEAGVAQGQQQPVNQTPTSAHQPGNVPQALSHDAARARANRSYTDPNYQPTPPQTAGPQSHAHPSVLQQSRERETPTMSQKFPIPKQLNVAAPSPVNMPASRPTLSGGPSNTNMGMMGQPAIQQQPGYVLEGDGTGRIIAREKIQELYREVVGSMGAGAKDALGGDELDPDVEDVRILPPFITPTSHLYKAPSNLTSLYKSKLSH